MRPLCLHQDAAGNVGPTGGLRRLLEPQLQLFHATEPRRLSRRLSHDRGLRMTLRWHKQTDCPNVPGCDCPEPATAPIYVGQTVNTDCGGSSGSSSSGSGSTGSSSNASSSGGSAAPCPCSGSCVCTAVRSIWINGINWECNQGTCGPDFRCRCNLPSPSPAFEGDVQASTCSCCQGCQWFFHPYPHLYWELTDGVGSACLWAECPHPCGSGPDWIPTDEFSVVAACGVNLATGASSGGSGTSGSSTSP